MYSNDLKIIEAMKTIKDECKKKRHNRMLASGCGDSCPFNKYCISHGTIPERWEIEE